MKTEQIKDKQKEFNFVFDIGMTAYADNVEDALEIAHDGIIEWCYENGFDYDNVLMFDEDGNCLNN